MLKILCDIIFEWKKITEELAEPDGGQNTTCLVKLGFYCAT